MCIDIHIVEDSILEPDQTFNIELNTTDVDVNIQNGLLVITITDNDGELI